MTVAEFISIWQKADLTERSGCQQHFCGLCRLIGHPEPAEADPTGEFFTFERGAEKNTGGDGWADVWKKGCFGWEYKGKHKDLAKAYQQLLTYSQALENPPLMVVCDMERIIVRTNFTNTPTVTYEIALADLAKPESLALLRNVFNDPEKLKPGVTIQTITTEAARQLAEIAQSMRKRGLPALDVAHFLDRMIFCLFAEDVGLLPKGLFSKVLKNSQGDPARFRKVVAQLFEAMAEGGLFGADKILHFNGNLFADAKVLDMEAAEIEKIADISTLDWSAVDPSIFGTLFERGLDPDKRSQLGAHYTSRQDIEVLVEPVVMQPLRREWQEIRQTCDNLLATGEKLGAGNQDVAQPPSAGTGTTEPQAGAPVPHRPQQPQAAKALSPTVKAKAAKQAQALVRRFLMDRLANVTVLDPACGSGNFLYVTLQKLKDLEKEVLLYGAQNRVDGLLPMVGPWQLYGIEINPYAYELAQMTVWIGYLQWLRDNAYLNPEDPVLRKLDTFKCMDAILGVAPPPSAEKATEEPQPGAVAPHAKPAAGVYRRNLPHMQAAGRTLFVTFCTKDRWQIPEAMRDVVLRHCLHDHGNRLWVHGVVVMPDHVHMVFTPLTDDQGNSYGLAEILSGLKGASSHSINEALHRKGAVWQHESFDHILRSNESARQKVEYICDNPVRKGIAKSPDEYPWLWREWVEGSVAPPPPAEGTSPSAEGTPPSAEKATEEPQPGAVAPHEQPSDVGQAPSPADSLSQPGAVAPHETLFEPEWPKVDFIVGNPPFLGGGMLRGLLGDSYVEKLFAIYGDRIPNFSDLCCYWFEKARDQIEKGRCKRAGLLATQGIRGGANREVLKRIKKTGGIFFAESDREWVLDGANVHVSMIGFDDGADPLRILDGQPVAAINADLTCHADVTNVSPMKDNIGLCFMGPSPKAPFDIPEELALKLLGQGGNVHGRPNSDVIRPVASAVDLTRRNRHVWTIDFAVMPIGQATKYEAVFEHVKSTVYPIRSKNRRAAYAEKWWQYGEARPGMRKAFFTLGQFLATPGVAKHRVFVKVGAEVLCNQGALVFARSGDCFFGVLHSRIHEVWARAQGTQLRERESGFRYTPTTCFETFPLPEEDVAPPPPAEGISPSAEKATEKPQPGAVAPHWQQAIAEAAKELDALRNNWLNPPEWTKEEVLEFPGSVNGPWARYIADVAPPPSAESGRNESQPEAVAPHAKEEPQPGAVAPHVPHRIGTVRYPRLVPKDEASAALLAKRTLTNLYNARPDWLKLAHQKLDEAVFAAYGWSPTLTDEAILEKLLALNHERSTPGAEA